MQVRLLGKLLTSVLKAPALAEHWPPRAATATARARRARARGRAARLGLDQALLLHERRALGLLLLALAHAGAQHLDLLHHLRARRARARAQRRGQRPAPPRRGAAPAASRARRSARNTPRSRALALCGGVDAPRRRSPCRQSCRAAPLGTGRAPLRIWTRSVLGLAATIADPRASRRERCARPRRRARLLGVPRVGGAV